MSVTTKDELLIAATDIKKTFHTGKLEVQALNGVNFTLKQGEFVALVGPSGSGKSTLLNLIGALDTPTSGTMVVLGKDLNLLSKAERADLRLKKLGFVFQAYNLVPVLTAIENVEFVLELQGYGAKSRPMALEILRELDLEQYAQRRPSELSGGQQQRVAIARAVVSKPRLVLADEPTANLDGKNAEVLMILMQNLRDKYGMTFLFSTHDSRVMKHAHRIVTLTDGIITGDEIR